MSTRAMYTFIDPDEAHHVYKHMDGDPPWAAKAIAKGMTLAWPMPRFEADEAAAAFIAANKAEPGGLRTMHTGPWRNVAPYDLAYRYEIMVKRGGLRVTAFEIFKPYPTKDPWQEKKIFDGTLKELQDKFPTEQVCR